MVEAIGAAAVSLAGAWLIWRVMRWLVVSPAEQESRRYRREMYRQQQASWHAQEEACSRPSLQTLVNAHAKPRLRKVNGLWLYQSTFEVGRGITPMGAYKDWMRKAIGIGNALK